MKNSFTQSKLQSLVLSEVSSDSHSCSTAITNLKAYTPDYASIVSAGASWTDAYFSANAFGLDWESPYNSTTGAITASTWTRAKTAITNSTLFATSGITYDDT